MKRKSQRKKIKEVTLSDIVENEIKFNGLRQGFSKALSKFSKNLKYKNSIQHSDLTNIPFVTIDGEDSKDFDDAVWSESNKKKTTDLNGKLRGFNSVYISDSSVMNEIDMQPITMFSLLNILKMNN